MEEGSFRCDANVSIRPVGQKEFGTRGRTQKHELLPATFSARWSTKSNGSSIWWKTASRSFRKHACGTMRRATNSMRSKEEAHDYRYFPDPDLVKAVVDED